MIDLLVDFACTLHLPGQMCRGMGRCHRCIAPRHGESELVADGDSAGDVGVGRSLRRSRRVRRRRQLHVRSSVMSIGRVVWGTPPMSGAPSATPWVLAVPAMASACLQFAISNQGR